MLARQNRLVLLTMVLIQEGISPEQLEKSPNRLGQRLGNVPDFVARKCLEQAQRTNQERLEYLHRRILETDLTIKQGLMREELSLELLVADLAARR